MIPSGQTLTGVFSHWNQFYFELSFKIVTISLQLSSPQLQSGSHLHIHLTLCRQVYIHSKRVCC